MKKKKKKSPSHTETDWVFCLEALGSLWPAAVVLRASRQKTQSVSALRDFLFYYPCPSNLSVVSLPVNTNHSPSYVFHSKILYPIIDLKFQNRGLLHLISLFTELDLSCSLSTLTLQSTAPAIHTAPANTATYAVSYRSGYGQSGAWTGNSAQIAF